MTTRPIYALLLALLAAIVVAVVAARWLRARRRSRRRHRHGSPVRFPIVLAHGLFGYDVLEVDGDCREYFRGVSDRLVSFNVAIEDAPGVRYASVVGVVRSKQHAHPLLLATWALLRSAAGPNDDVVPASSQRWGEVVAEIDADHFAQVGCSTTFDASSFYERLVLELGE